MKQPRSTGLSFIFKSKIYVFGGYSGDQKRSKTIEVYDPSKNYWESLNCLLYTSPSPRDQRGSRMPSSA